MFGFMLYYVFRARHESQTRAGITASFTMTGSSSGCAFIHNRPLVDD